MWIHLRLVSVHWHRISQKRVCVERLLVVALICLRICINLLIIATTITLIKISTTILCLQSWCILGWLRCTCISVKAFKEVKLIILHLDLVLYWI